MHSVAFKLLYELAVVCGRPLFLRWLLHETRLSLVCSHQLVCSHHLPGDGGARSAALFCQQVEN